MTLGDTLNRKDLHGLIAVSYKPSNMLMYVFAHLASELRFRVGYKSDMSDSSLLS